MCLERTHHRKRQRYLPSTAHPKQPTMSSSSQRYRRPAKESPSDLTTSPIPPTSSLSSSSVGQQEKAELKQAVKDQAAATSNGLSVLDVLRILGGIVLLSCGLSYLSTSGESMTWGYNAWWTRAREWKSLMVTIPLLPKPSAHHLTMLTQ
jgi:hypothetical protein